MASIEIALSIMNVVLMEGMNMYPSPYTTILAHMNNITLFLTFRKNFLQYEMKEPT